MIALEDVTPRDDTATDEEGREALERAVRRGVRFNFFEYGIPQGSVLRHAQDQSITCTVVDPHNVDFRGEVVSISKAAGLANLERGGSSTSLAGTNYWLFEDATLASIRARLNDDW